MRTNYQFSYVSKGKRQKSVQGKTIKTNIKSSYFLLQDNKAKLRYAYILFPEG